jgi:hypothetical protein
MGWAGCETVVFGSYCRADIGSLFCPDSSFIRATSALPLGHVRLGINFSYTSNRICVDLWPSLSETHLGFSSAASALLDPRNSACQN